MGRQGEGAGPRSFPHPRRAAPGRTAVAIAPVHANAPTQDFVWRLVSARCRRTGQPAIAVDVLASTHAFRPPLTAQLPGANQKEWGDEAPGGAAVWQSGKERVGRPSSGQPASVAIREGGRQRSGQRGCGKGGRQGPRQRRCPPQSMTAWPIGLAGALAQRHRKRTGRPAAAGAGQRPATPALARPGKTQLNQALWRVWDFGHDLWRGAEPRSGARAAGETAAHPGRGRPVLPLGRRS